MVCITLFTVSPTLILADSTSDTKKNVEIRKNITSNEGDTIINPVSCGKAKRLGRSAGFSHHWSTAKQNCSQKNRYLDNNKDNNKDNKKLKIRIKIPIIIFRTGSLHKSGSFQTIDHTTLSA